MTNDSEANPVPRASQVNEFMIGLKMSSSPHLRSISGLGRLPAQGGLRPSASQAANVIRVLILP